MKKAFISAICITAAISMCPDCFATVDSNIPAGCCTHEAQTPYNWYCKRTDDNSQPPLDSLFSFIEDEALCTYYIDRKNSDFDSEDKVIYLTFDAGYENGNVEKILDVLKEKDATGAFFILENLVVRNTDLVHRMNREGHLVCNHTASHPDMTKKVTKEAFMEELWRLRDICSDANIKISDYYRPPEGRFSEENLKFAAEEGYKTVLWSYAYADWDNNAQPSPDEAIKKVLSGTHNGEVILLHPTSATNAAIISELIDAWRDMGFRFGSLDELTEK